MTEPGSRWFLALVVMENAGWSWGIQKRLGINLDDSIFDRIAIK